ncbi:MAG: hypothetical protein ABSH32_32700 [Bryobacteraceae bacterium]|jgi:hypothetical protein
MYLRRRSLLLSVAVPLLALCPLMAANITYTISGTLGPVLSGSDPLGANGQSGILTAVVSTTAVPTSTTKTSATYTLPVGAITVNIGGTVYGTTGAATLKYTFPPAGPDNIVITAPISADGVKSTVVGTASLAKGSFTAAVTKHPRKFTPSPQTLTAATKAGGAGSQVSYTASILGKSVLGLSGTASN